MNLWRRSKSWLQDTFPSQKENFEPRDYLEDEKRVLKYKFEKECSLIEKRFYLEMLDAKLHFEHDVKRLEEEHVKLKTKTSEDFEMNQYVNNKTSGTSEIVVDVKNSPVKIIKENDCLEWDPINELTSYEEEESILEESSLCMQKDSPQYDKIVSDESNLTIASRDTFNSILLQLDPKAFVDEDFKAIHCVMKKFKTSDVQKSVDELKKKIEDDIAREYNEKFDVERKILCSVIDELEENVALLRKQKEDIVSIFESSNGKI